ncbi:MAG: hypothetical protein AUI13_09085 [Gemmatimonadetes bacterium 13_2_20CM_2_69_23]|nr:MAG: hypothetical protein AUI13_09085 [Gemmatimonadetes bacterium 13_2_20CM_2_69_23]
MILAAWCRSLAGQAAGATEPTALRPVTMTAGAQYRAGWLHRWLLGAHYRDLWTTPLQVDVVDLAHFGGGLTPLKRGGGRQTKSLRLQAADGHVYIFRSVDKDPTAAIPPELRATFVQRILEDQTSSTNPAGALVVGPLLGAAGVHHVEPRLMVMPDDPRLDSFPAFKEMLGLLEERPTVDPDEEVGFAGAERIASTQKVWDHLTADSRHRVDSRALLAARLVDVLVGDWDRHPEQWRWARFDEAGVHVWRPIPRDRDQAFSRLDGLLPWIARYYHPDIVSFGDRYPDLVGLTWNGRALDRRVLNDLEKPVWDSVAAALQAGLSDTVIDRAVHRLPPEYYARDGNRLAQALKRRRDGLRQMANRYYALLAGAVDVQATDEADVADVQRQGDGSVALRLSRRDGARYYARTFHPGETNEVRLYLHDGDDRVVVRGSGRGAITVRVITGAGHSELIDSTRSGRTFFHVDHTPARVIKGPGSSVDRGAARGGPLPNPMQIPLRDWGTRWTPAVRLSFAPDVGVLVGFGETGMWYGFRQDPYKSQLGFGVSYATAAQGFRATLGADVRDVIWGLDAGLELRASGIEVVRFYGFGNETAALKVDDYYRVHQTQYLIAPSLVARSGRVRFSIGPLLKFAHTAFTSGTLVDSMRPYGSADFVQVGAQAQFRVDARDRVRQPSRGTLLALGGSWYPAAYDVAAPFGEAHGEAAAYLTARIPLQPTLALRVAAKKVWGSYPFHEAAYVGGAATVRGFSEHRFAGDGAVYGNAELRLPLARIFVLLPEELGVFGLADAGRVYLAGETSDRWHAAVGGGLWVAFLSRTNTLSVAAAHSVEGTRAYVRAGFGF